MWFWICYSEHRVQYNGSNVYGQKQGCEKLRWTGIKHEQYNISANVFDKGCIQIITPDKYTQKWEKNIKILLFGIHLVRKTDIECSEIIYLTIRLFCGLHLSFFLPHTFLSASLILCTFCKTKLYISVCQFYQHHHFWQNNTQVFSHMLNPPETKLSSETNDPFNVYKLNLVSVNSTLKAWFWI